MVTYTPERHHYAQGQLLPLSQAAAQNITTTDASPIDFRSGTMAYSILSAHNKSGNPARMSITFDAMASHDITYVGIVQTARASGMTRFPLPYVLTNCHNSLCAVGGTINEDDHLFGLSAAEKYGGEFVPAHLAVIHQYMRERYAGGGRMILASDSHTRYGPYGTLAMGEGGPELVKQLLSRPYEIPAPEVVAVWLTGAPRPGVGPQDVALALIATVFPDGLVKNKILEFIGPGIAGLSMDFRNGIDVMTTETTCLSSIWATDGVVKDQLTLWGRGGDYKTIAPQEGAGYDAVVRIDLSKVEPMIALPFHPSAAYPIRVFKENMSDLLHKVAVDAKEQWDLPGLPPLITKVTPYGLMVDQGVVVGCSGGLFENITAVRDILQGQAMGQGAFALSVYPASQPMFLSLTRSGVIADLLSQGVTVKTAFCGPCFGAGDVPSNNGLSIRHATRNFPNREGSKPKDGQTAFVALMDARSIAATAARGGLLTSAFELDLPAFTSPAPDFDLSPYTARVYQGVGKPKPETSLRFGPNIADWPAQIALPDDLILTVASALYDPVTTTDELIPSGETSSYRSNPHTLSEFTLSRRDPGYVERSKAVRTLEQTRQQNNPQSAGLGSVVVALKPGDGSAREQAASCQRVLGGVANIAREYATKRYRSNLINWGMIPFVWDQLAENALQVGDQIEIKGIRAVLLGDAQAVPAIIRRGETQTPITLSFGDLTRPERDIILAGCLINFYAGQPS